MQEKEINIVDMFLYVIQRWRALLIWLVIGAVVFSVFSGLKGMKSTGEVTGTDAYSIKISLTEERLGVVEEAARNILSYQRMHDKQEAFNQKAYITKLDSYNVNIGELKYYITNNPEDELDNNLSGIIQGFASALKNEAMGTGLEEIIGEKVEYNIYRDLISVGTGEQEKGFLTVSVFGDSEELVTKLKDNARTIVNNNIETLMNKIEPFTIELIGDNLTKGDSAYVRNVQNTNITAVSDYTNKIKAARDSIADENEKIYLEALVSRSTELDADSDRSLSVEEVVGQADALIDAEGAFGGASGANNSGKFVISPKNVVIGALLGLIIIAIIFIIRYVISKTIKSPEDLKSRFGVEVLGIFNGDTQFNKKHKAKLDIYLRRVRSKNRSKLSYEENIDMTAAKIEIAAGKAGIKNICIVTDLQSSCEFIDAIITKINGKLNVSVIRNVLAKADALQDLSKMEGAVLVEQVEISKDQDIADECLLCTKYGLNVIGGIVLE